MEFLLIIAIIGLIAALFVVSEKCNKLEHSLVLLGYDNDELRERLAKYEHEEDLD